jgi:glycosyltransferase involved in cell wall biosynthesis
MRIAQVAPLYESVPPKLYGGTERVVSYLTEELVRQGHDVTLFASGDSVTSAHLWPGSATALRLSGEPDASALAQHLLMIERVAQQAYGFDIVHFHLDFMPFSAIRYGGFPALTTLHGRQDIPGQFPIYREFNEVNLVSISDAQRSAMPWANWVATVHHGLPIKLYTPRPPQNQYLAFLGRISPEKRVDRAVEIARRAGMELRVAAKVDEADRKYFETVRADLAQPHVQFLEEIGDQDKCEFLSKAAALVFPIDWPEPFGLVMIEAMACGTPVIAFRGGSVEEIIEDGVTGYIVDTVEEAVEAVGRLATIDREKCREVFEERFSSRRMCDDYLRVYERIIDEANGLNGPKELQRAAVA